MFDIDKARNVDEMFFVNDANMLIKKADTARFERKKVKPFTDKLYKIVHNQLKQEFPA